MKISVWKTLGTKPRALSPRSTVQFTLANGETIEVSLTANGKLRIDSLQHHPMIIKPISHDALIVDVK